MERRSSQALHTCHVHKPQATVTRFFAFFYSILLFSIISFRLSSSHQIPFLPWLLLFSSEIFISFLSLLNLCYQWRPVTRTALPERLLGGEGEVILPAIDVFVFTADPKREPAVEVMNTVISAMALDYPTEKLAVYLSDDGGSPVTLVAAKEALRFARWWIPFCRKYNVATRCPKAYFCGEEEEIGGGGGEFLEERIMMEERYELFKEHVRRAHESGVVPAVRACRAAVVEIINLSCNDAKEARIPHLIYVSREKSPAHPHHFKAGAINALLRVSSIITNAPYILVLDCDMYCNDPSSAIQAMCFHLDPEISPSLAFVQFPQKFHNISSNDIYGSQIKTTFDIKWPGMDGFKGPMVSGTCFYMKRRALYGSILIEEADFVQLKQHFGPSNELIKSIQKKNQGTIITCLVDLSSSLLSEAKYLASCTYEQNTSWGHEIGFLYGSVVEDYFTGFKLLHCSGWNSVYYNPPRPAFLGIATTNLNDTMVQNTRWQSGLLDVTLSRHFPLVYGPPRMSLLQSLCYASLALQPFYSFPIWCLSIVPQLCLIHGIAVYPKASSPWFMIFIACFLAPKLKHLEDILMSGGSVQYWWNEDRMWMIRSVTSFLYGIVDGILKKAGLRLASFTPTNKVDSDANVKLYKMGKFNFQVSPIFLVPPACILLVNMAALLVGVVRLLIIEPMHAWDELLAQIFLAGFVLVAGYPMMEGMFMRTDKGRIQTFVTIASALFSIGVVFFGYILLVGLK